MTMTETSIGTSTASSIPFVVRKMREVRPARILDMGCGSGRWGVLAREFLEYWEHRFRPGDWRTRITGVDINPTNWTPVHDYVYDAHYTDDARTWKYMPVHDLIIATDVLEHMDKPDAMQVMEQMWRTGAHVIVGIPLGPGWLRGGFDGNPHEAHLSEWEYRDFMQQPVIDHEVTKTEDPLPYGLFHLKMP